MQVLSHQKQCNISQLCWTTSIGICGLMSTKNPHNFRYRPIKKRNQQLLQSSLCLIQGSCHTLIYNNYAIFYTHSIPVTVTCIVEQENRFAGFDDVFDM